jgi:hypothetical protein
LNQSVSVNPKKAAGRNLFFGIFLVALSTLMYEILLTRIFSVTMGYHFAFMAVSLAMFGMTLGAIITYLYPQRFPHDKTVQLLTRHSLAFSVSMIVTFLIHIAVPFIHGLSIKGFLFTALIYTTACVPFVFSGICISLLLTRYTNIVNRLYSADLIGAALGCILVVIIINYTGGPTSVFITAMLTSFSTIFFALEGNNKKVLRAVTVYSILLLTFSIVHTILVIHNEPLVRLYWVRGDWDEKPLYEKWNSFSRVTIDGDSTKYDVPFAWGLSNTYDRSKKVRELMLNIDANSTTVLSKFDGDLSKLKHLEYDVANIVQYIKKNSDILIIGSGAGRDVLTSLYFGQKSILGIEINKDMISAINNDFGNFTGHLDKYPNVKFVGDEARSYIQRPDEKFDIIQVSVIDNWSASASGAFVLTENALYTKETWKLLFEHLKPDGIITVTRFYRDKPAEHYRLIAMCSETLLSEGIQNPRDHLLLVKVKQKERTRGGVVYGTGTILLSKAPFTKSELSTIDSVCTKMEFEKVFSPTSCTDSTFAKICSVDNGKEFIKNFPLNITPPTDDKPFYFHQLRMLDIFRIHFWRDWDMDFNAKAIIILLTVFSTMFVLTVCCIIIPLKISSKKVNMKGSLPLFMFFGFIGLGFMFVEISQIQRLNIFLGHPTYSITTALFTLLLSSGLGSYVSGKFKDSLGQLRLYMLLAVLIIFGICTPFIIIAFREQTTFIRIIISSSVLLPLGFFMGMAFPLGLRLATLRSPQITPWLWGINGVTSVLASVVSVMIAMGWGISYSYWTGFVCYGIATIACYMALRKEPQPQISPD